MVDLLSIFTGIFGTMKESFFQKKGAIREARPVFYCRKTTNDYGAPIILQDQINMKAVPESQITWGGTECIIKNIGKDMFIVDRIEAKNIEYRPISNKVVEKDHEALLRVEFEHGDTLEEWRLFVKDCYGNEYCYEAIVDSPILRIGEEPLSFTFTKNKRQRLLL